MEDFERIVDQGRDEEDDITIGSKFSSLVSDCDLRPFKKESSTNFLSGQKRKFKESGCPSSPVKNLDLATPRRINTRSSVSSAKKQPKQSPDRSRRL